MAVDDEVGPAEEGIEDLEDTYLAEEALDEHYQSGGRALSMEEVLERYARAGE